MESYKDNNCNLDIIDREKKILFSVESKWWEYPWWFDKQYYDDDIDINTIKSAIDRLKDIFDSSWIIEERIRIIQDAEKFFKQKNIDISPIIDSSKEANYTRYSLSIKYIEKHPKIADRNYPFPFRPQFKGFFLSKIYFLEKLILHFPKKLSF